MKRQQELYQKNYARAEKEAQEMIKSVQNDAKFTASNQLAEEFGLNSAMIENGKQE